MPPPNPAARGLELTGLSILHPTSDPTTPSLVLSLVTQMHADIPTGGVDIPHSPNPMHLIRFWSAGPLAPLILFIHGGSWRSGTYLDSLGSQKVQHLVEKGYAFASVNYTLVPNVSVEEQVQEVANALAHLRQNAGELGFDPARVVLMGHSSGAHVAALLGTDTSYLQRAGVNVDVVHGVVALDGSNYNAFAEMSDSPGPVAESTVLGLGTDPQRLRAISPVYHAGGRNARAFLLLHVQRRGDVRQAVEFSAALAAAGTRAELRVFEGEGFEGHVAMLLRLGDVEYPATRVLDKWLGEHVPVNCGGVGGMEGLLASFFVMCNLVGNNTFELTATKR
jgi:acetyl esterase/lipase